MKFEREGLAYHVKYYGILILMMLLTTPAVFAAGDTLFEARKSRLIDVVSGENETSFYAVSAKLSVKRDLAVAFTMLDSLCNDRSIGGNFYAYTLIGTYLRFRDILPDSLHQKVREAYRMRSMYRGDTENHWVTYYTGMYLAAQTWPGKDGSYWFNGKSSTENFEEAKGWLEHWMRITTTIGQGEFDSPTYMTVFLAPMMVLYDFAADPVMKKRTQMILDFLFADFAVEHLEGNFGGGHSRDYPDDIINPLGAPSTMWAWLYFGEPQFEQWNVARFRPRHRGSWETIFGALSSYRLPEIIRLIATDRKSPYVHTETKRVRNVIRFGDVMNPPVYKYTYMTSDYVIGSLQGGILQPIQQHTWDVTFVSEKPNNTLFTLHPYYAGKELAMFFPEERKFLAGEVDRYHLVYTSPDKWNSSSPFEQTFQHKNAIIVLYKIPEGQKQPHIDGFFPRNLDQRVVDSTGWIFCRAGNTFIGFYSLKPYEWIEESVDWRWRSHALKNGVVVQVGSVASDNSFEAFCTRLRTHIPQYENFDSALSVSYVTTGNDVMQFTYDGARMLNGGPVSFKDYRFYHGPFMESELGSGVITLKHGTEKRVLDFIKGEIY